MKSWFANQLFLFDHLLEVLHGVVGCLSRDGMSLQDTCYIINVIQNGVRLGQACIVLCHSHAALKTGSGYDE